MEEDLQIQFMPDGEDSKGGILYGQYTEWAYGKSQTKHLWVLQGSE